MRITKKVEKDFRSIVRLVERGVEPRTSIILGPPGIGKTEMIKQLAMRLAEHFGKEFVEYDEGNPELVEKVLSNPEKYLVYVYMNLNEVMAEDLIGIPSNVDGYVRYKPLAWAMVCHEAMCVIHFDEITSVIDDRVKSAAMKIICERMVGYVKLSKETAIFATGNNPEENAMATLLPAPFVNKAKVERTIDPPTIDEWGMYMNEVYGDLWNRAVYAYLKEYPSDFLRVPKEGETLDAYPSPRSWTNLAVELEGVDKDLIVEYVGTEVASKLVTYLKTKVDFDAVVKNPDEIRKLNRSQKYILASWLACNLPKMKSEGIIRLLRWMSANDRELMKLVFVMMGKEDKKKMARFLLNHSELKVVIEALRKIRELRDELGL